MGAAASDRAGDNTAQPTDEIPDDGNLLSVVASLTAADVRLAMLLNPRLLTHSGGEALARERVITRPIAPAPVLGKRDGKQRDHAGPDGEVDDVDADTDMENGGEVNGDNETVDEPQTPKVTRSVARKRRQSKTARLNGVNGHAMDVD